MKENKVGRVTKEKAWIVMKANVGRVLKGKAWIVNL